MKKATCRKFAADEKIRIVLEDLRSKTPVSEICRRKGVTSSVHYKKYSRKVEQKRPYQKCNPRCHWARSKKNLALKKWVGITEFTTLYIMIRLCK